MHVMAEAHRVRSTPTCVGNTRFTSPATFAHVGPPPRAWGIRYSQASRASLHAGPPPRAWGIPWRSLAGSAPKTVHPHVRGEYDAPHGSMTYFIRSTPTCVGNTLGEFAGVAHVHGPPPRAWGIRLGRCGAWRGDRSTPTCVGNTSSSDAIRLALMGPPPRAWGIPECRARSALHSAVHPHVRGEYLGGLHLFARRGWSTPTCVGNTIAHGVEPVKGFGPPPRAWGIPRSPR